MSAAAPAPPDSGQDEQSATAPQADAARDRWALWRRYRLPALLALALVVVVLLIGVARTRSVRGELDPRAVDAQGSLALATLLADRGVDIRRLTSLGEATAGVSSREVVLVAFPDLLPADAMRTVGDLREGRVLLVGPGRDALAAVTEQIRPAGGTDVQVRSPDCETEAATTAGPVEIGGSRYTVDGSGSACYPADGDATLAVAQTRGGAGLTVLGSGALLSNDRLGEQGNAALALNLLGADGSADTVRWLVPAPGAAATGEELSLSDIVPGWVRPAALQLLVAALLAALWRARRLGPPVTEPLPVVVRAAEAVEGRARLYRRAQARDRAADALRTGIRARLAPRLGLGRGSGGEVVRAALVEAVASRSGRPDTEVDAVLYGPPPTDDASLVRLADTLDTLVRSTLDPEVRRP